MFESKEKPVVFCVENNCGELGSGVAVHLAEWFGETHNICVASSEDALAVIEDLDVIRASLALCVFDVSGVDNEDFTLPASVGATHPYALRAALIDPDQQQMAVDALKRGDIDRYIPKNAEPNELRKALEVLVARHDSLCRLHAEVAGKLGKHVFVTGATGFVGTRLVREILRCTDAKVTCLTRGTGDMPFDKRLPFTAEDYPGRLEFLEGDVTEPKLGLTPKQERYLEDSIDEVWHLAAITSFNEKLRDKIMRVNIEGTRALLELVKRFKHLTRFNHVSTAYVAGRRTLPDVSPEALIPEPPGFKNPYEESKWRSEHLVAASGVPYIIYRPSILIGESYSGHSDGKTVYGAAKIVHLARAMACSQCSACDDGTATFRLSGASGASLNVMPVDWVVDMFMRLRAGNPEPGSVFHVVHSTPTTAEDLMKAIAQAMRIEKWEFVPDLAPENLCWAEAVTLKGLRVFREYMTLHDPVFDSSKSRAILGTVECPPLTLDFLKFCIQSYCEQYADSWRELLQPGATAAA